MKKYGLKILLGLILAIIGFVSYTVVSTGYFRTIKNNFKGQILKKITLPGVEDITISRLDSFAILSSTDRKSIPLKDNENGGLYFLDLKNTQFNIVHLTANFKGPFAPHGISMIKLDSSYLIAAINHTLKGERIELFSLKEKELTHLETIKDPSLISPNDIVLINKDQYYFTNDHKYKKGFMRLLEDYAGLSLSNVVYFDGRSFNEVASNIAYANGINFDRERNLIFVASPRKFLIKVYKKTADGHLEFLENIACKTGVDNIEFDKNGNLWSGAHPNLLRFTSYAKGKSRSSPSEILKIIYKLGTEPIIEKVYLDQGENMSGSSVAAPFNNLILAGNVMDSHFLILKRQMTDQTK